ncbi:MAG: HAD family hydrolase [Acetivibrionales bacterium]
MSALEIIIKLLERREKLRAVVFDFDGTLSTLRCGWEKTMELMMLEMIAGKTEIDDGLVKEVSDYINQSTGIQTYYQMKWLAEAVHRHGRNPGASRNPWWYKAEYNRRLIEQVEKRIERIKNGENTASDYIIKGSKEFLETLYKKNIEIYVASGTDFPDVNNEIEVLGLKKYFKEVFGAPLGKVDCSKETVLQRLVKVNGLYGNEIAVIGDGKVEITLGREVGAITLGIASDEEKGSGINPIKRERLVEAGAHAITGDFRNLRELLGWLGI